MAKPFRLHGLSDRKSRVTVFGQVGKYNPSSFRDNLKAAVAMPQKDSCSTPLCSVASSRAVNSSGYVSGPLWQRRPGLKYGCLRGSE